MKVTQRPVVPLDRIFVRFAVTTIVFLLLGSGLSAEENPATDPPSEQPAEAAEAAESGALNAVEIPQQLKRATLELTRVRALLEPSPITEAIAEELPTAQQVIEGMYAELEVADLEHRTLRQLDDNRQVWLVRQSGLLRWQTALEERASALETEHAGLLRAERVWRPTLEGAADSELPQMLIDEVHELLGEIESTEADLVARRNAVLDLQSRIAAAGVRLATGISRIDAAQERASRNLFDFDRGPIWASRGEGHGAQNLVAQVGAAWRRMPSGVDRFRQIYGRRLLVLPALFVAVLLLLIPLRRRSRTWDSEVRSLQAVRQAVRRPVASALLVTLLPFRMLFPLAPSIIFDLALLLLMLPVAWLVPRVIWPGLRGQFYLLLVLVFIQQLRDMTLDGSPLERLLLLLINITALVTLVWILRPGGPARERQGGGLWSAVLFLGRLATFGLAAALVVNLLGAVKLAMVLTDGILYSALAAVVFLAVALIVDGLLTLLIHSSRLRRLPSVRNHGDLMQQRVLRLVRGGAMLWWGWATLSGFRLETRFVEGMSSLLGRQWAFGSFQFSIGNVLAFFVTIWVATLISRGLRFVLAEDVLPRIDLPRGISATISMLVHYSLVAIGFVLALAAAGFELGQFAILAGALGVGIGFGLQNLVNNFVSGMILIFERPIKVGDTVEVGPLMGEVRSIGIRASTVRTFAGAEVIVPNGNLIANEVINWTLSDRRRRIEIPVGVAYGTDPKRVMDLLTEVAKKQPDALERPEPWVVFRGFGESSLDFELRFWTNRFDRWVRVQSQATVEVHDALAEAGIEIPFPQRDLHVRSVDEQVNLQRNG